MKDALKDIGGKVSETASGVIDKAEYFTSGRFWDEFVMKTLLFIVIAVVVLVLVTTLFDGVRRAIRGLDVSLIGGVFLFFAYKVKDIPILNGMTHFASILGGLLLILGFLLFIVFKVVGKKRKVTVGADGTTTTEPLGAKGVLGILGVCILAICIGFGAGQFIDIFPDKAGGGTVSIEDVQGSMDEIQEMASLEYAYTNTAEYQGDALQLLKHDIPFTSKFVQAQYSGTVKMGPNLKDAEIKVNDAGDEINIVIPHSKILSHEIDEESFQFSQVKNGILNRVKVEDTTVLRKDAKEAIEKKIDDEKMLQEADTKAMAQIKAYFTAAYPNITVNVELE